MKLFIRVTQKSKIDDKVVDTSNWKFDVDVDTTKTVTTLINEIKRKIKFDESTYTISGETVTSDKKAAKKTDKIETLNLRDISFEYSITRK